MKHVLTIILILLSSAGFAFPQEKSLKERALDKFKAENYDEAIDLLEQALAQSPNDAEVYYYLGWFNHYRAYDSRPLKGYDYSYSEQIFKYLKKAIELNSGYGDAKYFFGAECSGNAFQAMQNYDAEKIKYFYELAYNIGAYPDWLIEFGKNFLNSCEENAILFTAGNTDFDVCSYLQQCLNYRTDITLISIGNIDRPWYVRFLKNGLESSLKKIKIGLSEQQVMDLHPYKWKETIIPIDISHHDKQRFNLSANYQMEWAVMPDLQSERMHQKIESEIANKRSYLSPRMAILLQIIEDNFAIRPIYFSNFAERSFYGGLNEYFENCGLISRLTPIKTKNTVYEYSISEIEKMLDPNNLINYKDIQVNNIPRISKVIQFGYSNMVLNLSELYRKSNNHEDLKNLTDLYSNMLKVGFDPEYEEFVMNELTK